MSPTVKTSGSPDEASPDREPAWCCAPLHRAPLDEPGAEELAGLLKALADPIRLRVLSIIASSPAGEVCACELPELLDRSQPTMSHHLGQLVRSGLLEREQRGKWAWFRLRPERLQALCAVLDCRPNTSTRGTSR